MFESILNILDIGIHVINCDGTTIFYNEKMAEIDGLSRDQVIGKNVLEMYPSLTAETSTLLSVIASGSKLEPRVQSYTNHCGQRVTTINQTIPLLEQGECIGAIEMARDISQMVRLNEQVLDLRDQMIRKKTGNAKTHSVGSAQYEFSDLIGEHPLFLEAITRGQKAARTNASVLIYGPTGSGKELLAHSIHNASARRSGPFIAQNGAAMPRELMEGILFGTTRGAFTGSVDRAGLFEQADGGTLFLDEIHMLDVQLQAKLLRVLQDGRVRRIGATYESMVDVRVLAAMNVHPEEAINRSMIRSDLFYRLNVISIELPSLHSRRSDIHLLMQHFLRELNQACGTSIRECSDELRTWIEKYPWPGNVREMRHVFESALLMKESTDERLTLEDLPPYVRHRVITESNDSDDQPPKRWII